KDRAVSVLKTLTRLELDPRRYGTYRKSGTFKNTYFALLIANETERQRQHSTIQSMNVGVDAEQNDTLYAMWSALCAASGKREEDPLERDVARVPRRKARGGKRGKIFVRCWSAYLHLARGFAARRYPIARRQGACY